MQVKFMAVSGSPDKWEAEQLAGKTLGVLYRLKRTRSTSFYDRDTTGASRRALTKSAKLCCSTRSKWMTSSVRDGERSPDGKPLSMVMGVYDPLGLISPALTRGKLLLTESLWRRLHQGLGRRHHSGEKKEVG